MAEEETRAAQEQKAEISEVLSRTLKEKKQALDDYKKAEDKQKVAEDALKAAERKLSDGSDRAGAYATQIEELKETI